MTPPGIHNPIVIFTGYFNPVRIAHVEVALAVHRNRDKIGYTGQASVLFLPAAVSMLGKPPFSLEHRIKMIKLAIEGHLGLGVLSIETGMNAPRTNYERLEELRKMGIDPQYWLVGSDGYNQGLIRKVALDKLMEAGVTLIVNLREGHDVNDLRTGVDGLPINVQAVNLEERVRIMEDARTSSPTSSSEVRRLLANGKDASRYIGPSVMEYIREHGIWRLGSVENAKPAEA